MTGTGDWYANVLASPEVGLRDGDLRLDLRAREVTGAERARWWSLACTVFGSYVAYQSRTRRRIPVAGAGVLTRSVGAGP